MEKGCFKTAVVINRGIQTTEVSLKSGMGNGESLFGFCTNQIM